MDEHDWLAERFEANRSHLRSVAYRMLGSLSEADDAALDRAPVSVMGFTVIHERIVAIDAIIDPDRLRQLDLADLDG
jgi:hypothetical protein